MKLWQSPETCAVNRAPVMPFLPSMQLPLDGTWRFQLLPIVDGPIGTDWRPMQVPSLWTMQGLDDLPQYTNVQMPFDDLPPTAPTANPTGIYEREFVVPVDWAERRTVVRVGGFENFLQVFINDNFVGMAKDGRLAADFDISSYLRPGENRIRLSVSKWSDATFIEDQDQWWHGGISRPVLLYSTPETHVERLHITPDLVNGDGALRISALIANLRTSGATHTLRVRIPELAVDQTCTSAIPADQTLTEAERSLAFAWFTSEFAVGGSPRELTELQSRMEPKLRGTVETLISIPRVEPWSAEHPRLYELVIEHLDPHGVLLERFELRIGFRSTRINGRELLVNGQPVTIYGVNRHDFDPRTGRVLSRDAMREDLLELKRWNVNAIRTSHYPNDPALLDLADELGFYIVDEANIEAHAYMHSLCDDPRYLGAFVDRISRMVQRDLHHPSVILWSLGNESGYGANHDAAAAWTRRFDPTRPLHYEGAIRAGWFAGHNATDVVCPMYPSIDAIVRYAESGKQDRPLIMCEYSHAMGNSNGNLKEYWDAIDAHPGLQGGFIWEMWDHGLMQAEPNGGWRYAYGGDFGEERHDGNFCLDGLFFPDRTAKPALAEFKAIASPVRITESSDGGFLLENRQWFTDTSDFVLQCAAHASDGSVSTEEYPAPVVGPRQAIRMALPDAAVLTVSIRRISTKPWAAGMAEVGWAQFVHAEVEQPPLDTDPVDDVVEHSEISLWRAPTDNDRISGLAERWVRWGLQDLREVQRTITGDTHAKIVERTLETSIGIGIAHTRMILRTGSDTVVKERVELPTELADVARVGVVLQLPTASEVTWFGAGPHETYPDRCLARIGQWTAAADALHTDYIRPQENGARSSVRWARVRTNDGLICISNDQPAHMSFSRFSDAQLASATHNVELTREPVTYVHIDAAHRGVGSASCGPDTLPAFRIAPGIFEWTWRIGISRD